MADYWKSTPRYWCKHCKQYVKDTPLEKRNHEVSPRHQGNLQRFIKDLHKANARETRDAERAKDEVARLKRQGGNAVDSSAGRAATNTRPTHQGNVPPKATVQERRKQMEQLAAMGVVVPEEFRKENAIVGDWQTLLDTSAATSRGVSGSITRPDGKSDAAANSAIGVGVRKRKVEEEEELNLGSSRRRPNWGSDIKTHDRLADEPRLDDLLSTATVLKPRTTKKEELDPDSKIEVAKSESGVSNEPQPDGMLVKQEEGDDAALDALPDIQDIERKPDETVDADVDDLGSMFKKRKGKSLKQR